MKATREGWLWTRPFKIPKTCRHCNGPMTVLRCANAESKSAVVACAECDLTERWPDRG